MVEKLAFAKSGELISVGISIQRSPLNRGEKIAKKNCNGRNNNNKKTFLHSLKDEPAP